MKNVLSTDTSNIVFQLNEPVDMTETATHLYTGTLNKTLNGIPCQRWDSQSPHRHRYYQGEQFPDKNVSAAENYCRDLNFIGALWCYTEDPNIRWKTCLVEGLDFDITKIIIRFMFNLHNLTLKLKHI